MSWSHSEVMDLAFCMGYITQIILSKMSGEYDGMCDEDENL